MKHFPTTFAIVDTETTGMRPPFSRVIDIGIIRIENGKEVDRFQSLVHPGVTLPQSIKRITGINDEDLQDAPPFEDIALRVEEMLTGAVFVAHNAPFDYSFIKSEFGRLGMAWKSETFCSVKFSRALYPRERSHSLESIIDRYAISVTARHRALPDADAVWSFFQHVHTTMPGDAINAAVARATGARTGKLGTDTFRELPDSAGVYFFYGPDQELLYIGKSKHVRTRARSHFSAGNGGKEAHIQSETNSVESVSTSGELSALILESQLIKKESPLYNKALRKRKTLVAARAHTDEKGYQRIVLSRTSADEADAEMLSLFRTITQGKESLRRIAKDYELCNKLLGTESGSGACFAYQLGVCRGACVGKESVEAYNARVLDAFAKRRIRTWPYKGVIMIDEKESSERGTVFFVDNWALRGAFRYDEGSYEPLIDGLDPHGTFDYDTYKILIRYLLSPRNKRSLTVLKAKEYEALLKKCMGDDESLVEHSAEYVIH